jgi:hypothetical protein
MLHFRSSRPLVYHPSQVVPRMGGWDVSRIAETCGREGQKTANDDRKQLMITYS